MELINGGAFAEALWRMAVQEREHAQEWRRVGSLWFALHAWRVSPHPVVTWAAGCDDRALIYEKWAMRLDFQKAWNEEVCTHDQNI